MSCYECGCDNEDEDYKSCENCGNTFCSSHLSNDGYCNDCQESVLSQLEIIKILAEKL